MRAIGEGEEKVAGYTPWPVINYNCYFCHSNDILGFPWSQFEGTVCNVECEVVSHVAPAARKQREMDAMLRSLSIHFSISAHRMVLPLLGVGLFNSINQSGNSLI